MSAGKQQTNECDANNGGTLSPPAIAHLNPRSSDFVAESRQIDQLCREFELLWGSSEARTIGQVLDGNPAVNRSSLLRDLLSVELELRWQSGDRPTVTEYAVAFPYEAELIETCFQAVTNDLRKSPLDEFGTKSPTAAETTCGIESTTEFTGNPRTWRPDILGYEVGEEIGRGGMGVVFKARHLRLDRAVALKVMIGRELVGGSERERFCREGEIVASLVHPNVAQVYDGGEQDGIAWLAMELVEGGTLADFPAPLSADAATAILAQVADALGAAHASGIVHRDVKPANILLTDHEDGIRIGDRTVIPKITDFGLARRLESDVSISGSLLGTPGYMAPEQLTATSDEIGAPADVHAIGVVLYELITGLHPYHSERVITTFDRIRHHRPTTPSVVNRQVSSAVDYVCLICLSKDPESRFANGDELAMALRNPESVRRKRQSSRWNFRTLASVVGVLLTAVSIAYLLCIDRIGVDESPDQSALSAHAVPRATDAPDHVPIVVARETSLPFLKTILEDGVGWLTVRQNGSEINVMQPSELPDGNFTVAGLVLTSGAFSNEHLREQLVTMTSLRIFHATYTQLNDEDLASLLALPQLENLDVYGTQVTNKGVESIAKMDALKSLSVGATQITIPTLVKLSHLRRLRFLNIDGESFGRKDSAKYLNQLPELETLQVVQCDDQQLKQVAQVNRIRDLRLFASSLQSCPCETLSQMPRLETLHMTIEDFHGFTFDFTNFPSLHTLRLNFDRAGGQLPQITPGTLKSIVVVDPYIDEPHKNYPAWVGQMPSAHVEVNGIMMAPQPEELGSG